MLTTDKKSRDCGVRRVQARTAPCGRERLSSEITLVSSRNNESAQSKAIGGRSLKFRRGGTRSSVRASSLSSNSFRLGRALPSRSCQSSAETKTAACFPRFVTICGPSDSAFSSISLKRALASWTCQAREPPRGFCRLLMRTSHTSSQLTRQGEPYSKCAKVPSAGGGQAIDAAPDLRQPSAGRTLASAHALGLRREISERSGPDSLRRLRGRGAGQGERLLHGVQGIEVGHGDGVVAAVHEVHLARHRAGQVRQ